MTASPPIHANVGDTLVVKVNNQLLTNESSSFSKWDQIARSRFSSRVDDYYPPGTDERVAIHWHGLSMRGSPEQDGAPGFTSCAILPDSSQTYRFQIQQEDVGTHWWHSHTGMARSDGLWGTLTVLDSVNKSEEELLEAHTTAKALPSLKWDHEQVITLGDHYFAPGVDQISWFISRHSLDFEPTPDNILINGQGRFNCSRLLDPTRHPCTTSTDTYPKIQLEQGKTHRLRLINVGSVGHQTFSIDHHMLTVIESDGSIVEPYTTTRLSIAPGQRYSVLVSANQPGTKAFWLRSEMDHECFNMPNPNLDHQAKAIVQYTSEWSVDPVIGHPSFDLELRTKGFKRTILPRSNQHVLPQTQPWPRKQGEEPCHDEDAKLLRPLRAIQANRETQRHGAPVAPRLDLTAGDKRIAITVTMPKLDRNGLVPVSWINRTQWTSPSTPLLRSFALANTTSSNASIALSPPFNSAHQTILSPSASDPVTLDLIINNSDEAPYPFHLHGHKFHLMAISESNVGFGTYNPDGPNDDAEWFDEESAPYRDIVSVPRRGFAILRWRMDNPGIWAMHCHVLVHMQTGMALAIVDQPNKIGKLGFAKGLLEGGLVGAKCPSHLAAAS
ncbi:hypothetical protein NDA16_004801 [Ustilago loliicola]|nr:hypothetical protein NDA16_004801 [Ustilago loliicola]